MKRNLYIMMLNGRRYLTTSLESAWGFCTHHNILIEDVAQTTHEIDVIEYQERSMEEIYETIQGMIPRHRIGRRGVAASS